MKKLTLALFAFLVCFLFSSESFSQNHLEKLLTDAPDGYASLAGGTTGGLGGRIVTATTGDELHGYMDLTEPLIIYVKGTLNISGMNNCRSNKTILGLGNDARIVGGGIYIYKMNNIIVRNISFENSSEDGFGITNSSHHIWVDHCNFTNGADGLFDIKEQSNYITISWCKFYNHSKVMLIGHKDGNTGDIGYLKVSVHHNWWQHTVQRHPRVRYGEVHVYNNYYDHDSLYGVVTACQAKVLVEGNYFQNIIVPIYSGYQDSPQGDALERSNKYENCGSPVIQVGSYSKPSYTMGAVANPAYSYSLDSAADVPAIVMANAGVGIITTGVEVENPAAPRSCLMLQNYPNPFNPCTSIKYETSRTGKVVLNVYNMFGEKVAELVNQVQQAGFHIASFTATALPSGTYISVLESDGRQQAIKMILLK